MEALSRSDAMPETEAIVAVDGAVDDDRHRRPGRRPTATRAHEALSGQRLADLTTQ